MSAETQEKVRKIFGEALNLPISKRSSFLDETCGPDTALRSSVESLLDSFDNLGSGPSIASEPTLAYSETAPIRTVRVGDTVGKYKLTEVLGTGGMGEVFLAEDPKLGRRAAIKFLRKEFSRELDPLKRFTREARSASALNHPNIITIYDIGESEGADYIAMEYVQGKNLRLLISEGKLTLKDCANIAMQVASALEAAHASGIIHRDIKPENIIVRPDGIAKVLDFGLAKFTNAAVGFDSDGTTMGADSTIPGVIMGTITYMSPEQARGKPTDARTDIWSLGVVLYEMIAGRPPFTGETKSDLIVSILKSEPAPMEMQDSEIWDRLQTVLKKALAKDADARYGSVREMNADLKMLQSGAGADTVQLRLHGMSTGRDSRIETNETQPYLTESHEKKRSFGWMTIPAAAAALSVAGMAYYWMNPSAGPSAAAFTNASPVQVTSWKSAVGESDPRARISPDGKLLAYVAVEDGATSVWLKQIDGGEPFTQKKGNSVDLSPIWSPDSSKIAFVSDRDGQRGIWAAPALGGAATLLTPLESLGTLVRWSKDGSTIYFQMGQNLHSVDIGTRSISKLTNFDETAAVDRSFDVSADGTKLAFVDVKDGQNDLWTSDLKAENPVRLTNDPARDGSPVWFPDGKRIAYNSDRNGVDQIFVISTDGGEPVQITRGEGNSDLQDISSDGGTIMYASSNDDSDIWGIHLNGGMEFQLTSEIGAEFWPAFSPQGDAVVYQAARQTGIGSRLFSSQIISQQISPGARPASMSATGYYPTWSPDGAHVAFLNLENSLSTISVISTAGGDARKIAEDGVIVGGHSMMPFNRMQTQDVAWTADGKSVIYSAKRDGVNNIWSAAIDGSGEKVLTKNTNGSVVFVNPALSPDGSTLAWTSFDFSKPAERTWALWVSSDGHDRQIYRSDSSLRIIGWSPNGEGLIVKAVDRMKDAWPMPLDVDVFEVYLKNIPPRQIVTLKDCYQANVRMAPDGSSLAFVAREQDRDVINLLPLDTRQLRTVVASNDPRVYLSSLTFSPDGQTLYYGKQADWKIISMLRGTN